MLVRDARLYLWSGSVISYNMLYTCVSMARAHVNPSISNAFLLLLVPDCKAGGHFQNAIASRPEAQRSESVLLLPMIVFNNGFSIAISVCQWEKLPKLLIWRASEAAKEKLERSMSADWGQSRPFLISKQMNSQCVPCQYTIGLQSSHNVTPMTSGRLWDVCMELYFCLTGSYNDYCCNLSSFYWILAPCTQNNVRNHIGKVYSFCGFNPTLRLKQGRKRCLESSEDRDGIHMLWHGSTFQGVRSFARISGRCCGEKSALQLYNMNILTKLQAPIWWLHVWHQIYTPELALMLASSCLLQ